MSAFKWTIFAHVMIDSGCSNPHFEFVPISAGISISSVLLKWRL
jgi:hypothetical protein